MSDSAPLQSPLAAGSGPVAPALPVPPGIVNRAGLGTAEWGMLAFLLSEVAFFSTLIVTYLNFLGQDRAEPTPRTALSLGLVIATTVCLLSSSVTIHLAEDSLHRGRMGLFNGTWALTILLGAAFLAGTGYEWRELIVTHHLTIDRNLFGTTFYTLVGFHGLHVTIGLIALGTVLWLSLQGQISRSNTIAVRMVSWYWHFVDGVWIVVFAVVYLFGR